MAAPREWNRMALRARGWGHIALFCRSPPPNLTLGSLRLLPPNPSRCSLTSRAHVWLAPAQMATAVLPAPRSTAVRFVPISARGEQEQA